MSLLSGAVDSAQSASVPVEPVSPSGRGLDHVTLTVTDLAASARLFDAVLEPLHLARLVDYEDPEDEDEAGVEAVGYGVDTPVLWLVSGPEATRNTHLAFAAGSRAAVDGAYAAALAAGATARSAPRPWQIYRPGRYTAMIVDGNGNVVELVVDES